MHKSNDIYMPKNNIRVVTATSLFDGHDASINIFRRILQSSGAEVIHLGHNRSVKSIVNAAVQEDVQGVAVSSYQGGHMEFFKYMVDELRKNKAGHIKVFCGGGGVIIPEEKKKLEEYDQITVYSPEDGSSIGLIGIVNDMIRKMDYSRVLDEIPKMEDLAVNNKLMTANLITYFENAHILSNYKLESVKNKIKRKIKKKTIPVIGITGTGGAGKSSITDELVSRLIYDFKEINIAIISADPSRRKSGGALLGDRIRMNSIEKDNIYMRSVATRNSNIEVPVQIKNFIDVTKASGYDIIVVETAGIGQGNSNIVDMVDVSIYVMTSDFGSASQLEKINMLDFANLIVINKYEKRGSKDAAKAVVNHLKGISFQEKVEKKSRVFGTIASNFNDEGIYALYHNLLKKIESKNIIFSKKKSISTKNNFSENKNVIIPSDRINYLSEIVNKIKKYHEKTEEECNKVRVWWHFREIIDKLSNELKENETVLSYLNNSLKKTWNFIDDDTKKIINEWKIIQKKYSGNEISYNVRKMEVKVSLVTKSFSNIIIPKISLPKFEDLGEIYKWMRKENLPGYFPYTSGVFPIKRVGEDPTRMFAGEGDPKRTNRRFKLLSSGSKAKRLSTAFDSVTLYGCDPDIRPDIYGKIGNSGVSVCTLDDVRDLYDGFNLCSKKTSVSMTINGPAPIVLAMFFNAAIYQELNNFKKHNGRVPTIEEYNSIKDFALKNVRGTIQADILKEDQGQNTCIFSTNFSLKMMGDIQQYFIDKKIDNFYSVSISGYHIAEAGANPITQLAFTLANGFTYVEYYLSRGMNINEFARNLSFFFSNGMDPEYVVIGRVARRVWSIALKEKYRTSKRSQMLKYHIQTSGRSLHSQDINFNDVRTTLQALCAIYDNCNSLHTNSYDEAITTPTEDSVRRALAIQLIINREWGLTKNENSLQGSFFIEELTDLVESAVLAEFKKISDRGGVLGAMETGYQRNKIQEESISYESAKHDGKVPIAGVNFFRKNILDNNFFAEQKIDLARSTSEEKESQIKRLEIFKEKNRNKKAESIKKLQEVVLSNGNIFEELMNSVHYCSLGEITSSLYEVGGQYRRGM